MTRNEAYLLKGEAKVAKSALVLVITLTLVCLVALGASVQAAGAHTSRAFADESIDEMKMTAYELQLEIEQRQESYAAARAEVDEATEAVAEKEEELEELEREIPEQEARSAAAARDLYKFQQQSVGLVDMLLGASSLQDFIKQLEYVNHITDANVQELNRLYDLKAQISGAKDNLNAAIAEANARVEDERAALEAAQQTQAEVQRRIEEEARAQAEIALMAEKMAEQERLNDQGEPVTPSESANTGEAQAPAETNDSGESADEEEPAYTEPAAATEVVLSGDEASFVNEWAPRIDAYLAGSPLAGQGTTFARAAYQYGVDPRFSPAISFTESSKGLCCFLPHNAWGWGSASWDSWEEAIYDHVAGLASGYGGQISIEGAQKYCPPNWQAWYDRTLGQMELI